jgi:WD40 repeat protein
LGGANDGCLYLYDRAANSQTMRIAAHSDDVNAVSFVDENTHILASGGDDGLCKVKLIPHLTGFSIHMFILMLIPEKNSRSQFNLTFALRERVGGLEYFFFIIHTYCIPVSFYSGLVGIFVGYKILKTVHIFKTCRYFMGVTRNC